MKITLMVVGKTTQAPVRTLIDEYSRRISRYNPFEILELPDVKTVSYTHLDVYKRQQSGCIARTD